ncbi:unnamed protein product, partial [Urochloa humidicola]
PAIAYLASSLSAINKCHRRHPRQTQLEPAPPPASSKRWLE